jgi:phosphotransferase system  glucose/maltose/N-acetylglucosamine-specific IIC component
MPLTCPLIRRKVKTVKAVSTVVLILYVGIAAILALWLLDFTGRELGSNPILVLAAFAVVGLILHLLYMPVGWLIKTAKASSAAHRAGLAHA